MIPGRLGWATMADGGDPDRILEGLNDVSADGRPGDERAVAILAGAGTGKTRVISRRAAYAIETGVVGAAEVLLVTFTDKAATEMAGRMRDLGQPQVTAPTFHAQPCPSFATSGRLATMARPRRRSSNPSFRSWAGSPGGLPGGYRYTPVKDLAGEIEWAKNRRLGAGSYGAGDRRGPA